MPTGSLLFMLASWAFVLALAGWSFYKLLTLPAPGGAGSDSAVTIDDTAGPEVTR